MNHWLTDYLIIFTVRINLWLVLNICKNEKSLLRLSDCEINWI